MNELKKLRKDTFNQNYVLDQELITLAKQETSHLFLANHSILLIYTYLVHYIKQSTEKWLGTTNNLKILDWGSGKGHITYLLKREYHKTNTEILSCDIADTKLANSDSSFRQNTPIIRSENIQVTPLTHAYQLPFSDEYFDVVISMGVLEHVPQDTESLKEIFRVLKPKGLFFCFFLPYQWSWTQKLAHWRGNFYHDRLYSKRQVREMMNDVDFTLLDLWHRQLFPKNSLRYPNYPIFEKIDQVLCVHTPLKYLATNIEFVAVKPT